MKAKKLMCIRHINMPSEAIQCSLSASKTAEHIRLTSYRGCKLNYIILSVAWLNNGFIDAIKHRSYCQSAIA